MAIAKTCVSEITLNKEHERRAFGYLTGTWGLGMIIGPVIGGLLSRPKILYPNIFSNDSIFAICPYFLPCLLCAIIAFVAGYVANYIERKKCLYLPNANIPQSVELYIILCITLCIVHIIYRQIYNSYF